MNIYKFKLYILTIISCFVLLNCSSEQQYSNLPPEPPKNIDANPSITNPTMPNKNIEIILLTLNKKIQILNNDKLIPLNNSEVEIEITTDTTTNYRTVTLLKGEAKIERNTKEAQQNNSSLASEFLPSNNYNSLNSF